MEKPRGDIPVLKPGVEFAEPGEEMPEIDAATAKLYKDSLPKTVQITTNSGSGSGLWMDKDGTVGTAAHVVLGSREQFATAYDGKKYRLEIVKLDDINDTAILKPVGYKPGSYPFAELGSSKDLKNGDPVFPIGHPQGRRPAYISPGNFAGPVINSELLKGLHQLEEGDLQERIKNSVTPKELDDMKAALGRALLSADVHIRPGDSGGPVFNPDGKVVGLNDLITSFEKGFFVPVEKLDNLYKSKDSDFKFTYQRTAESWANDYKNTWVQSPLLAGGETLTAIGAGYFANRAISAFPRGIGAAATFAEGGMLYSDAKALLNSTDSRDQLKYSLASVSDLAGLAGGLAILAKCRTSGAVGLGVGILGRMASDFVPNRLVLSDIERKSNPVMPPFNQEIEKTLGLH